MQPQKAHWTWCFAKIFRARVWRRKCDEPPEDWRYRSLSIVLAPNPKLTTDRENLDVAMPGLVGGQFGRLFMHQAWRSFQCGGAVTANSSAAHFHGCPQIAIHRGFERAKKTSEARSSRCESSSSIERASHSDVIGGRGAITAIPNKAAEDLSPGGTPGVPRVGTSLSAAVCAWLISPCVVEIWENIVLSQIPCLFKVLISLNSRPTEL